MPNRTTELRVHIDTYTSRWHCDRALLPTISFAYACFWCMFLLLLLQVVAKHFQEQQVDEMETIILFSEICMLKREKSKGQGGAPM